MATCGHCREEQVGVQHVRECAVQHGYAVEGSTKSPNRPDPSRPSSFAGLVPDGVYAVEVQGELGFYKVSSPTSGRWAGYVFVQKKRAGRFERMPSIHAQGRVLSGILNDGIQESMERYGIQTGTCGHCGRQLTNPDSLKRGIGPICASKMGL